MLYPIESISINRHREYGYNFNPMKELFRKVFDLEDRDNSHITSNVTYLGEDILINVEYNRTFLRIEISEGLFKLIPTKKSKIVTFDSVKIDSFLIRHHFDIYGMVYNGIAGNKDYYSKNIKELCG